MERNAAENPHWCTNIADTSKGVSDVKFRSKNIGENDCVG